METNPELERSMLQRYFTLSCSLLCLLLRSRAWWKLFRRTSRGRGWPRPPSTTSGWVPPTCPAGSRTSPPRRPTMTPSPGSCPPCPRWWGEAPPDPSPPLGLGPSWMGLTLGPMGPSSSSKKKLKKRGRNCSRPFHINLSSPCERERGPWKPPNGPIWNCGQLCRGRSEAKWRSCKQKQFSCRLGNLFSDILHLRKDWEFH